HPLDIVHHSLKANHAEAEVYYINLPQDSTGTVGAYVMYEDLTKNVNLQYDQYSGALLYTGDKWEDKTNGKKYGRIIMISMWELSVAYPTRSSIFSSASLPLVYPLRVS
ncbi:MAG: hypothetical protein AAGC85_13230, partial [Bacteroidota bacterium]